ncbi:MAG: DUF1697 domain-containing protein [Acidobacteriaceae bacterium]|nr:DUF1697 domain-containing protein [Acidobacteriaceae bacterium]
MRVVISMLRGVNVGPHKRVKMDAVRALYESLGLEDPKTFLQSGNVLFKTGEKNLPRLAKRIEDAIEQTFGFESDVILRTTVEMREALGRNPFAKRGGIEPTKLLFTFLASDPGEAAREKLRQIEAAPEEMWIEGRELYIYFPNGMARPKLSIPLIERTLKVSGTGRNWNSVQKMLEMAEEMES